MVIYTGIFYMFYIPSTVEVLQWNYITLYIAKTQYTAISIKVVRKKGGKVEYKWKAAGNP
jgi:hypothetical protein